MRISSRALGYALLLPAVADHAAIVMAQSRGTFTATGNMTTPRHGHTATLLHSGKVLIAGGAVSVQLNAPMQHLASAELYDPSTGTFTGTGEMTTPRRLHTATLLPDGKVLIAGGTGSPNASGSAEVYDPSTGTFRATEKVVNEQLWHTATLLPNGKVLITGGSTKWPAITPAELYDPATGGFAATGAYAIKEYVCEFCPPATLLPDGKVLFAGTRPTQLYDPASGAFSSTGAMRWPLSSATLLMNGMVLFTGGEGLWRYAYAELYDHATGTFASVRDMARRRVWHAATSLPDGTALITGGESETCSGSGCVFSGSIASAELYDPSTGTFIPAGDMTTDREVHTATLLNDGTVLITGGVSYGGIGIFNETLASAELYRPEIPFSAPRLFSLSEEVRGQGAILHAGTALVASPANPAAAGEALEIYGSGLIHGSVIPPQVSIGGRMAEVLFFGEAPGFAGLNQVNVRVPSGVGLDSVAPVRLTYLGRPSNEVTVGVR